MNNLKFFKETSTRQENYCHKLFNILNTLTMQTIMANQALVPPALVAVAHIIVLLPLMIDLVVV